MAYVLLPALVVVAGLVATAIVSVVLRNQVQDVEQGHLQSATERAAERIEARFDLYSEQLFGLRPLFEGDPHRTTRAEFQVWLQAAGVFERLPGIQALSFVRVVASADRDTFEAAVRQDNSANGIGYPEFEVNPDSEASRLFVVDFIEPMEGNKAAFGFDIGTSPDALIAVETARDTGDPVATAPITLVQETEDQKGMVLLLGVYDTPSVPTTEEVRRSSLSGLISAVFRIDDMLAGALGADPRVILEIYDVGPSDAEPLQPHESGLLSDSDPSAPTALEALNSPGVATAEISVGGRRWLVLAEPTPALGVGQDASPQIALATGITLSLLLGALVASRTHSRHRAERLDQLRTAELTAEKERFEAVVRKMPSAISVRDLQHRYTLVNEAFCQLFGNMSVEDVVGRTEDEILPPDVLQRSHLAAARPLSGVDSMEEESIQHRAGNISVMTQRFPLNDAAGAMAELVTIQTDITHRKTIEQEIAERDMWAERIEAAIGDGRLLVYSQPIVDIATRRTVSEELLVRLRAEETEQILPPIEFLPQCERYGLLPMIDRYMIGRAIDLARTGRHVSVNITGQTIADATTMDGILEALTIAGPEVTDKIAFEITETTALASLEIAKAFSVSMQDRGCRVALDDFGTGYGTFTELRHLALYALKIDLSFVQNMLEDHQDERVVRIIISVAREYGLTTIAEGVESEAMLERLAELGADLAQGYLFAKPMPIVTRSTSGATAMKSQPLG